ncbi:MAG: tetratricopeptide repeat protein, partial [Sphingomonadales bacterium]|nr:tetratricopeptide repeat protein [Sphingomonadales bacterium]
RAIALLEPLAGIEAPPNVMFNLAWSKAMVGAKDEALELLAASTTTAFPAAAMLRTQLLHEAGDFEGALAFGKQALAQHPDDAGLNSAVATLALDLEDLELARACAVRGGEHPEALAAIGMLVMQDGNPAEARASFEQSLAKRQHNPRAWIGRGLTRLVEHDPAAAADDLDCGAQQFGDHIGSWIAAGWAHYLSGDINAAGQRFERALAIDPAFAESHGSLAVIDITRGDEKSARRRLTTALRLDRNCFSAALAQAMLQVDNPAAARKLIEQAFETPLNARGMTIAGYLAGMARPTVH